MSFPAQDDVTLAGWYLPCPGATRAVVLLHDSRRNRLSMAPHTNLYLYAKGEYEDRLLSFITRAEAKKSLP